MPDFPSVAYYSLGCDLMMDDMASDFPPRAVMSRRYTVRAFELSDIVEQTLQELGWKYELVSGGEFVARVGLSFWSFGEKVHVKIAHDGVVVAESQLVWPQWFDWGKNQRNLFDFFHRLWDLLSAAQLIEAATREHPYIDVEGRSPLQHIIGDSDPSEYFASDALASTKLNGGTRAVEPAIQ